MDNNYTNLFVKTKRGVIHFGRAAAYPFIHCGCPPPPPPPVHSQAMFGHKDVVDDEDAGHRLWATCQTFGRVSGGVLSLSR